MPSHSTFNSTTPPTGTPPTTASLLSASYARHTTDSPHRDTPRRPKEAQVEPCPQFTHGRRSLRQRSVEQGKGHHLCQDRRAHSVSITRRSATHSSGCRYAELDSQLRSPLNPTQISGRVLCRRDRQCIWVQSHRVPAHLLYLVLCYAQAFIPEPNMLHPSLSPACCSAHR